MYELVTGLSLASAAGLNAYIPLLGLGLLSRFTDVVSLPSGWLWLENGWAIGVLAALLLIEIIVDKVPALDTVNDVLQSLIRPASGGLVFSAGAGSETVAVADPAAFAQSSAFWPFVIGACVALVPHLLKLVSRPVINALTLGAGAMIASVFEDLTAALVTLLAVLIPLIALALIVALTVFAINRLRKLRARRRAAALQV